MRVRLLLPLSALIMCASATAAAPLFDFETDVEGWECFQEGSAVSVSRTASEVKSGASYLEWSYAPGSPGASLRKAMPGLKNGAGSLDFWLRCSATACFQMGFREQDGSSYILKTRVPAGEWQHYNVDLSDLMLGEGAPGNGRFDPEEVNAIILDDLTRLNVDDQEDLAPRTVWIDGFALSEETAPVRRAARTQAGRKELVFDEFDGKTLNWLGRVRPELSLLRVDDRTVLRARYKQSRISRFRLTDHMDPRYAGLLGVRVVVRAATPTTLSVQFLERPRGAGAIYRANVDLPAGKEWKTIILPITDFLPSKKDDNDKLDLQDCYLIQVMDLTPNDEVRDAELEIDSIAGLVPNAPLRS
jgi:hypothetical protein